MVALFYIDISDVLTNEAEYTALGAQKHLQVGKSKGVTVVRIAEGRREGRREGRMPEGLTDSLTGRHGCT